MENAKAWWASKTIWIAVLQGLLGVFVAVGSQIELVGWLMIVKSVIDVLLRIITEQPVK
jgi:hypothetical protein